MVRINVGRLCDLAGSEIEDSNFRYRVRSFVEGHIVDTRKGEQFVIWKHDSTDRHDREANWRTPPAAYTRRRGLAMNIDFGSGRPWSPIDFAQGGEPDKPDGCRGENGIFFRLVIRPRARGYRRTPVASVAADRDGVLTNGSVHAVILAWQV